MKTAYTKTGRNWQGEFAGMRVIAERAFSSLARRFRIQGAVRLQALISKDGTIGNLSVLGGHPMLIPAAWEAVWLWQHEPPFLNGVPVEWKRPWM